MINDPNYNLPKDAFIRLFDNSIPAGDPARSEAPEWAQELDEVVVWAHMGDNGAVSVKVNGEDIGGGGEDFQTATITLIEGSTFLPVVTDGIIWLKEISTPGEIENVLVPTTVGYVTDIAEITGSYDRVAIDGINYYVATGDCTITYGGLG